MLDRPSPVADFGMGSHDILLAWQRLCQRCLRCGTKRLRDPILPECMSDVPREKMGSLLTSSLAQVSRPISSPTDIDTTQAPARRNPLMLYPSDAPVVCQFWVRKSIP